MIIETPEGPAVLLEHVKRMELKRGDRIVVFSERNMSQKAVDRIISELGGETGNRVIVMDAGLSLAVIGPALSVIGEEA